MILETRQYFVEILRMFFLFTIFAEFRLGCESLNKMIHSLVTPDQRGKEKVFRLHCSCNTDRSNIKQSEGADLDEKNHLTFIAFKRSSHQTPDDFTIVKREEVFL